MKFIESVSPITWSIIYFIGIIILFFFMLNETFKRHISDIPYHPSTASSYESEDILRIKRRIMKDIWGDLFLPFFWPVIFVLLPIAFLYKMYENIVKKVFSAKFKKLNIKPKSKIDNDDLSIFEKYIDYRRKKYFIDNRHM